MAWTETCKIDFRKQIDHKKDQGVSVRQALKQLSEESDIPIGTLTNWMYPERQKRYQESVVKNDNTQENVSETGNIFDGLTPIEQTQIVQDAENQILQQVGEIRKEKKERQAQYQQEQKQELTKQSIPEDKYQTIIIDPPWPIEKIIRDERPNQDVFAYPTMSIEEITDFKVADFAADNCHIYMWSTHKFLPVAFLILDSWGFKYQCLMTWRKNVGFTPFSWMYSTEHALFGRKGSLDLLKKGIRLDFEAKVREHSRKPNEFYEIVKTVSPGPRIDIFSREPHEGFDQFGNEQDKF